MNTYIKNSAIIFIAVTSIFLLIKYYSLLNEKQLEAAENAKKINFILKENFDQTEKTLMQIGEEIARKTPDLDLKIIHHILEKTPINPVKNIYSWSLFDWVNSSGYQTVNTVLGIRKNGPHVAEKRSYSHRSNELWVMLFSEVAMGIPSAVYVIPVGVQIDTKKYPRAGTVTVGINIKKLMNNVEARIGENTRFLVIDKRDDKFVLGSVDQEKYVGKIFYDSPGSIENENYIFEKEMDQKYPYIIWTGYDLKQFWHEFRRSSLIFISLFFGVIMGGIYIKWIMEKRANSN
ncbi:MAG: hypothetical protein V4694_06060 [Pseudomonadota bacterium]